MAKAITKSQKTKTVSLTISATLYDQCVQAAKRFNGGDLEEWFRQWTESAAQCDVDEILGDLHREYKAKVVLAAQRLHLPEEETLQHWVN